MATLILSLFKVCLNTSSNFFLLKSSMLTQWIFVKSEAKTEKRDTEMSDKKHTQCLRIECYLWQTVYM